MFHWCPEETAAVIAAGTAAAGVAMVVRAKFYIALAWLRRKLGLKDERHCCKEEHKPPKQKPMTKAEALAQIDAIIGRKATVQTPKVAIQHLKDLSDGLEPLIQHYRRTYQLPDIDLDEKAKMAMDAEAEKWLDRVLAPKPTCRDGHVGCHGDDPFDMNGGLCRCTNVCGLHDRRISCPPKETALEPCPFPLESDTYPK